MKRIYILLSAIPLFLTSCFESSNTSNFQIYRDERVGFITFTENKDSEKEVHYLTVNVKNESDNTVTLNKTDFKLKFSNKTYDCLYFVDSWKSGTFIVNGVQTSYSYIDKTSDTKEIKKQVENEYGGISWENIYVAFEAKPEASVTYEILYKDTALKTVFDK